MYILVIKSAKLMCILKSIFKKVIFKNVEESFNICYFSGAFINSGDKEFVLVFSPDRISGSGYATCQPSNKYRSQFIIFFKRCRNWPCNKYTEI